MKYRNNILYYLFWVILLSVPYVGIGQQAELSVQQGHTGDITHIDISADEQFFATADVNNKVVLWDLRSGSQMYFLYAPGSVKELQFSEDGSLLHIQCKENSYSLNIAESSLDKAATPVLFDNKAVDTWNEMRVEIDGPKIILYENNTKIKVRTSDYFDQPFHSVKIDPVNKFIYAGCEDGNMYVYSFNLALKKQLKTHQSSVNDMEITREGSFLYSASSDRSVIVWKLPGFVVANRITGRSFPTYGVSLNKGGDKLMFGDEFGYVRSIDFTSNFLEVIGDKVSDYPISFTGQWDNGKIAWGGNDNKMTLLENGKENHIRSLSPLNFPLVRHAFSTRALKFYKSPLLSYEHVSVSPDQSLMAYGSRINRPYIFDFFQLTNLETGRSSKKLYHELDFLTPAPQFVTDNEFITIKSEVEVRLWKFDPTTLSDFRYKTTRIGQELSDFAVVNENYLLGVTKGQELLAINYRDSSIQSLNLKHAQSVFPLTTGSVLVDRVDDSPLIVDANGSVFSSIVLNGRHQDKITSAVFDENRNRMFTTSLDATVKVWDLTSNELLVTIIPIGQSNAIYVTPDNYYLMTGKDLNSFGFKVGEQFIYPEQFDPKFNRPDIVLKRLGYLDTSVIDAYEKAYQKRLKKLNFTEEMLGDDFHIPELFLHDKEEIPTETNANSIEVHVTLKDEKYFMDRLNVWVNDVAVYGINGVSLRNRKINTLDTVISVNLASGSNKVQFSVLNTSGGESFKETVEVTRLGGPEKGDLYIIALGASKYQDADYNLTYASKDASDLVATFTKSKKYNAVHQQLVTNEQVNRECLTPLIEFLSNATIHDEVILFYAGHGVLNDQLDYFFATYDMDFSNPDKRGIAYEDLDQLLDGIKPLKKIILIDACNSGEIDKEEVELVTSAKEQVDNIQFRTVGNTVAPKLGMKSISELSKTLFVDLRRGTGATVISSAGGMEYAMESSQWKNGLFTYCLLNGIKSKKADLNRDGNIMLKELKKYVGQEVFKLSKGQQAPTTRIENNAIDFLIWN